MSDDIANAPRTYTHQDCGTSTRMPDEVRSKYLYDPYYYADGLTICAQCGMVPDASCEWDETGQNLDEYMKELQGKKGAPYHVVRWGIWVVLMVVGAVVAPGILAGGKGQIPAPWDSLFGVLVGGIVAMFVGRHFRFILCRLKVI